MIAATLFSLKFESVQTYFAQKTAKYLAKQLGTRVEIKRLKVVLFKSVQLEGFVIEDKQKDILLSSPRLTIDLNEFSLKNRKISVQSARMDNGQLFLKKFRNKTTNLDFIIEYFKPEEKLKSKKKAKPYDVTFNKIVLNNIRFRYRDYNAPKAVKGAISFGDIDLSNFNASILNLDRKNHLSAGRIERLTFREKSGFYLKNFSSDVTIDTNQFELKNLMLETRNTRISNYLQLKFNKFSDFGDSIKNIYIKADLKNSQLDAIDLQYFVPGLKSTGLKLEVDGKISGFTENIKARDFSVKVGQATYMKGNFNIRGMPDLDQTFLDLQFDQVFSNKKDAERIIKQATGKTIILPDVIQKFGNIYFKGRFTGFPKDFIADGEFKTSLGRFVSDVNMKIGKTQVYTGTLKGYDFNIGQLLNNEKLGRTTFSTSIKGQGFDIEKLREDMNTKISYLDFNGYRYKNVDVKGKLNSKLFEGKVTVNDPNLDLDFNGGFDLSPELPLFNFIATIRNANLHALHFTKDTLRVDADFKSNFSGTNLDNIQGEVQLKEIQLSNTRQAFTVDSVSLTANGIGNNRSLSIKSDILDAGIKGDYDIETLPSYFIKTARKYLPSLPDNKTIPEAQNFDLSLKIKYFEPLGAVFAPDLKIPEGAQIDGKFTSAENKVTLSGSSKLVTYKGIKINDLSFDETNSDNALYIILTSDRIDFNDSLYVKNINIANILQNDSLSLNIKLSDKDAANQLDLNGLVEFGRDSTFTFNLLPSDIIINRESWKVTDKVKIGYDKGKTSIAGFQLFRDNQLLTINGTVSPYPEDHLILDFAKFKLSTFNALTKGAGISLLGEMNGKVSLSTLLKNPVAEAGLKIDSLVFNKTAIGSLTFNAEYDNEKRVVNSKTVILKNGKETLRVEGTFDIRSEENSLDMAISMDNGELIILEPFLKTLVSNLKGTISADMKLTGTLKNPLMNGSIGLNNATMTINYLKTTYHITDNVNVKNSVINLDGLVLKDIRENQAVADGTVDLTNLSKPVLGINIVARDNFMALNTTERDNPLYFGIAYGAGNYRFQGPTDDMRITITARTGPGTVFNIPLNSASQVIDNALITFVPKDPSLVPVKVNSFGGLTMNFDLTIDENTQVNIITEQGKLTGKGTASLNLNISSAGDFLMNGNYLISEGKFDFNAQDYLNKVFEISNGGSIKWAGNPLEANINLRAVYRERAALGPLYLAAGRGDDTKSNTKVLAEAVMILSDRLLKPSIAFELNFPANPNIKDELQSYLSDPDNVAIQASSLILRRSFAGGNSSDLLSTSQLTNTGLNALTEVLFNQVNNLLAQTLGLNFVDLNIRSFNEASATLKFFNDRLIITGGITDNGANVKSFDVIGNNGNATTRDLEAQYLIKKDGSLTLRASNRLDNGSFLTPSQSQYYVNALGLVYRQDFDNFKELMKIISGQRRREEKEKATTVGQ